MFLTSVSPAREALTSGLTTIANDMTGAVSDVLPIALGVMGAGLLVTFGIKLFRRFSK